MFEKDSNREFKVCSLINRYLIVLVLFFWRKISFKITNIGRWSETSKVNIPDEIFAGCDKKKLSMIENESLSILVGLVIDGV